MNMVVRQEDGRFITALDIARKIGETGDEVAHLLVAAGAKSFEDLKIEFGDHIPDIPR